MKQGYIHIYCGEGKGKTSILNGMAVRAVGSNMKVKYIRFLKNRPTSENKVLEKIGVEVENYYHFSTKFIWDMNEQEVEEFKIETQKGFERLKELLKSNEVDLIIVDEILGALENKFIDKEEFVLALKTRNQNIEVALSGRYSFEQLDEIADLISEVKPKKHYFEKGVNSRKGIEF
ncbi:cob(I)yrinic acid a,c-diamide adenosyltransferase [Spiroplasma culicicola]|uniref:Cobalamin adenosyltransferase n=1 Tax=Spiroplasma culicicola AES-1 TaxID=1276246 RepID=W6A8P9_9MOLU|nr:cob(I)yrinic acid a,c-diamide adenosyltransferase [Spiroplasma culicicola]AHI53265.1 cobalamin adenosyltransferase [Spiroplasma culicicola AES-1]